MGWPAKKEPETDPEQQSQGTFRVLGFSNRGFRSLPKRDHSPLPPNSFLGKYSNVGCVLLLWMLYWIALLVYSVTVRVLAAPGDLDSKALGRIDRAQDIETYCIVVSTISILALIGKLAVILVPMAAVAVGLAVMEAVRLSTDEDRRIEHIMLCVLSVLMFFPTMLSLREGVVWYKWYWENKKIVAQRRAALSPL